ncbi:MAG: hypothetical protein HY951_12110 [Bacteroidia bacterium]|nr:hypothetical protein [Bacteroidia bacterium]
MKNYILVIISIFLTYSAWTQDKSIDYKLSVKLYNLSSYDIVLNTTNFFPAHIDRTISTLKFLNPTIAFQWKSRKNNFKEIELKSFSFSNQNNSVKQINDTSGVIEYFSEFDYKNTLISLRYEYIYLFNKSKNKRFNFSLGFAISPYYRLTKSIPRMANSYGSSNYSIGIDTYLIPRLTFFLSKRFYIDFNIPFCISELDILTQKSFAPQIPIKQRKYITFNLSELPKMYSCRLGIGIKI